jgi:hypothetical protein
VRQKLDDNTQVAALRSGDPVKSNKTFHNIIVRFIPVKQSGQRKCSTFFDVEEKLGGPSGGQEDLKQ